MNDLQIEYFLATAENLSFTKTANEKYVSQPAVSKQISALEEELGVELFERGYKSTRLTPAGLMFAEFFRKQFQDLDLLCRQARENEKSVLLTLRIGCGSGWTMRDMLPGISRSLKEKHGDIRICLENCAFNQVPRHVYDREMDVGLTLGSDIVEMPILTSCRLLEVPRVIMYSREHHLAGKEDLVPADFKNEWFLVPQSNRSAYIEDLVNSFCEPYDFAPEIQTVRNTESLMNSVLNGLGVAIADYWTYETMKRHCCCVPLESTHTITAVWRKDNKNPLIKEFVRELQEVLGTNTNSGI